MGSKRVAMAGEPDRRVLILGGGFGGIYTALELEKSLRPQDRTEVTLVNAENYFLFTPFLAEVASSSINTSDAINPIRRMFQRVRFFEGQATGIDLEAREVTVCDSGGRDHALAYDHLVVALGSQTGFFGMEDVEEHAITVKTLGDAIYLRNWAIQLLEAADVETDPEVRAELLTFVVAGGGSTGIEIAGELNDLVRQSLDSYPTITQRDVRIILVESQGRLVPEFGDRLALFAQDRLRALGVEVRLHTTVSGASDHEVLLKDAASIRSRTLAWVTGVAPHLFVASSYLPKDEKGWITVDPHLRILGLDRVWSLGDCARVPNILKPGTYHPSTAQHAIREARQLGRNIAAEIRGEPTRPFRYKTLGQMATLGHFNGVGLIGPFTISGFAAWALWRSYYLYRLPRLEKRLRVATDWTVDLFFGRDISQIQTSTTTDDRRKSR